MSSDPHALRRLRAACERAKHTLSSSERACIEIDSLFDDTDFNTSITRTRFEELCSDLFSTANNLFPRVVSESDLTMGEIDDIVLSGGSGRIPFIQKLVSTHLRGKEPKISMNPDEDVARGAAIQASAMTRSKDNVLNLDFGEENDSGMPGGDSGGFHNAGGSVIMEEVD